MWQKPRPTHPGLDRRTLLGSAAAGFALAGLAGFPRRAGAGDPVTLAAVYTVPTGQPWVSRIHAAAQAAVERAEITYVYSENVSTADYPAVLRDYAEAGHQLILGEAFAVEQQVRAVAADYPDTFFLMGSSFKPDPAAPNVAVFDNAIQDAAYLSGIIAGSMTASGRLGLVGGFPLPEVNRLMHAFMAGARETRADATFQIAFINSWFDPDKARQAALAMIDAGVDMLYAERSGAATAAQERGVLAIGNIVDIQADYPETVVTSALWNFEPTLAAALSRTAEGSFEAADYSLYSLLRNGGSSLAPFGTFGDKLPAAAVALVDQRIAALTSGDLVTAIDETEPKSS